MCGHRGQAIECERQRSYAALQRQQGEQLHNRIKVREAGLPVANFNQGQVDEIARRLNSGATPEAAASGL